MNWKRNLLVTAGGLIAGSLVVMAAPTNLPAKAEYAFFSVVPDRNIFNPNRYPHRAKAGRTEPAHATTPDAFTLVGTMSYGKGTFAFFAGSTAEYQKVLARDGEIAGFRLAAIQPNAVLLTVSNNTIQIPVGAQLRRDEEEGWQLVPEAGTQPVERAEAPAEAEDAGGDPGDVLKKLMQKREQELQ